MLNLAIKIRNNRILMFLFSFLLIFAVTFHTVVTPVVHAEVVLTVATACALIAASIALSSAVGLAKDPTTLKSMGDCFNSLSPSCQESIKAFVPGLSSLSGVSHLAFVDIDSEVARQVYREVANCCADLVSSSNVSSVEPITSSGYIGFTDDSRFRLYYPEGYNSCIYPLTSGHIAIYQSYDGTLYPDNLNLLSSYNGCYGWKLQNDSGLAFIQLCNSSSSFGNTYFEPWVSDEYTGCGFHSGWTFLTFQTNYDNAHDSNGVGSFYDIYTNNFLNYIYTSNGWRLCYTNGSYYDNKLYSSLNQLFFRFFESCGLKTYLNGSVSSFDADAVEYDDGTGITYDSEAVESALSSIASELDNVTSLRICVALDEEGLDTLIDNPAAVLDNAAASNMGAYPSDLPVINAKPDLWQKFPFSLPWDIYRLVSVFASDSAEAPSFHLLLMPENSFGLDNEAFYFDFDFQPYDKLVRMLRFFLSLAFVFFLIVVTRRLIGGGG